MMLVFFFNLYFLLILFTIGKVPQRSIEHGWGTKFQQLFWDFAHYD